MVYYNQTNHPSRVQKSYECTSRSVCNCTSVPLVQFANVRVYPSFGLQLYEYTPSFGLQLYECTSRSVCKGTAFFDTPQINFHFAKGRLQIPPIASHQIKIESKSNQIKSKSNRIKIKSQPFSLSTAEPTRIRSAHTPLAIRAPSLGRYSGEGRPDTICRHPTARSPL